MKFKYFAAMKEAIRNLFSKPNTIRFPAEHVDVPSDLRGAPSLEKESCTLCTRCESVCPTGAISIIKFSKTEGEFTIDLGKCCYCGECEDVCNFDAIKIEPNWLTSKLKREELKTTNQVVRS